MSFPTLMDTMPIIDAQVVGLEYMNVILRNVQATLLSQDSPQYGRIDRLKNRMDHAQDPLSDTWQSRY